MNKNFNFALFFGCCVISIGIVIAGLLISTNMPDAALMPRNLSVTTSDGTTVFREYMSEYEAAGFLMLDADELMAFIQTGELNETFTVIQGQYVFSKEKLTQWINRRIEGA